MDIMLDIESLSLHPTCAILQVGACQFEPDGHGIKGRPFLVSINRDFYQADTEGWFDINVNTVEWWDNQPPAAKESLNLKMVETPEDALGRLDQWIAASQFGRGDDSCIWAQGPQFDIVAMQHLYSFCDKQEPWEYYQVRDSRTMIREAHRNKIPQETVALPDGLILHRADHDAVRQVFYLQEALRVIKINDNTPDLSGETES